MENDGLSPMTTNQSLCVGVLALQGDFAEHINVLQSIGTETKEVRTCEDFSAIDALVIPGGESTVMMKLLRISGLDRAIIDRAKRGMPIFGTCAGAILLSDSHLHIMDITVDRNAYGSQAASFSEKISVDGIGSMPVSFIRAPKISATGQGVRVLAKSAGVPVLVQEGQRIAACFHPELHGETALHRYFLEQCAVLRK